MAAGNLSPLNMQAYAIDLHPVRGDGAVEALKLDFDGTGGMFVAFVVKWSWDVNFTQIFGFPIIVFEDDAVNGIIGSANGGAGMWNQDSGNGQTWQQLMDSSQGQLAVNAQFAAVISTLTVRQIEQATQPGYFLGVLAPEIQFFRDKYVDPASPDCVMRDPGPPPGRVAPEVLFPPESKMIGSGEGVVKALASLLTITGGKIGAVAVP